MIAVTLTVILMNAFRYFYENSNKSRAIDSSYVLLSEAPLIRVILRENPEQAEALRNVIREDVLAKSTNRTRDFIGRIRREHTAAAFAAADADALTASWSAQLKLYRYLAGKNADLCSEIFRSGISDVRKLDEDGRRLWDASLQATEAMYLNGRGRPSKADPLNTDDRQALALALEITPEEAGHISNLASASAATVCALAVKIFDGVLTKVHGPFREKVMRHFLMES